LFFAGAVEFEEHLPTTDHAQRAVVVLILRGRDEVGSTFLHVLERYNEQLRAGGGKLMLRDVSMHVREQLGRTGVLHALGEENIYTATPIIGETTRRAVQDAQVWLRATR